MKADKNILEGQVALGLLQHRRVEEDKHKDK